MNLNIDWGNTRVKVGIFEKEELIQHFIYNKVDAFTEINELLKNREFEAAMVCTVSEIPDELIQILKNSTRLFILDDHTPLPLMNAYSSSHLLGMDRIALAVAAYQLYPNQNNLVICAGTAITYNFCHKANIFRGGNISPGINMRLQALHEYTSMLPLVTQKGEIILLGYDTDTGIRSGVIIGTAAEIEGMVERYQADYPDINIILTGGDATLLGDQMKNKIFADPYFLLKGLNTILNYNISK